MAKFSWTGLLGVGVLPFFLQSQQLIFIAFD
jgi:hypothetical protein